MKKVIMAILMVATREKVTADLIVSGKGGHISVTGSVEVESQNEQQATLAVWRGGEKSMLVIQLNANDLSVNCSEQGCYDLVISGVSIRFRQAFNQDPFTVNTAAVSV